MEKTVQLNIESRIPLLPEETLRRLCANGTGPVSDACPEALVIGSSLYPLDNYPCVGGLALTVDAGPADNLTVWASLKYARPGDVLFVSTQACMETSVCGDLLIGFAKNGGVAAVITDGCIRDFNGIRETELPVFAAGTSPKAPVKEGPGKIGYPVTLAGVEIQRDMVVVCDRDGIVAFDHSHLESTLKKLDTVEAKETKASQEISDGRTLPTWIEPVLDGVKFIK